MKYSLPRDVLRAGRDAFARPNYPFRWILACVLSWFFRALLTNFSDSWQLAAGFDLTDGFLLGLSVCEHIRRGANWGFRLLERLQKKNVKVKITETTTVFATPKLQFVHTRRETIMYK